MCSGRCVLLQTCHVRYSSGHVWSQLPDSFMMGSCERKDCIWLSIRPHLEHLRQCSESLACCNWSVAGAWENYLKGHFVKISHEHFKKSHAIHTECDAKKMWRTRFLLYDIDTIDTELWGTVRSQSQSTAPELSLASTSPLWHTWLISPYKTLQWYLYSLLVTDT